MEEVAGLIVLLFAAAIVINLIQGGWSQVGQLFRAKFLGQPAAG